MRVYRLIAIILSLFLLFGTIPVCMATPENEPGNVAGCYGLDAMTPYLGHGLIVDNSQAVFLYERNSDTLMYAQNPDTRIYPSSLVKILTAYLAVEAGDLDSVITVKESIVEQVPYDAVSADLQPGEQLTLRDLLYCMMVGSANDAASVIADHVSGSQESFVQKMNEFAQSVGCTDTHFTNAHGLHDEAQYSTVRDLAKIISGVLDDQVFVEIFSASEYTVPATNMSEERKLISKNFLMTEDSVEIYYDSRITGGRTGIGNDGKRCIASTAEADGMELICILMGAESTYAEDGRTLVYGGFKETTVLCDAVFEPYKVASVIFEGQAMKQVSVTNGENDLVIGVTDSINAVLPKNVSSADLAFRYSNSHETLEAPVNKGDLVSGVEVWYGNICIAYTDLYAMNCVRMVTQLPSQEPAEQIPSEGDEASGSGRIVLIVIISFFAVVGILAYVFRFAVKKRKPKKEGPDESTIRRRR